MSSYEAFVTNSASSGQSGILPPSLLESASLSAPLDDNSSLTSVQSPSRNTSGSDPINSESERLLSGDTTASGDKNRDSVNPKAVNPQLPTLLSALKEPSVSIMVEILMAILKT